MELRKKELGSGLTPASTDLVSIKRLGVDKFTWFESELSVLIAQAVAAAVAAISPAIAQAVANVVKAGTPVVAVASTNVLTLATNPLEGEEIEVGDETYVFTATPVGDFDVEIGLDVAATQANLLAVISDHSALVTASAFADDASTFTAKVKGAAGDEIATTTTLTAEGDGFTTATLDGGVDGTVAVATQLFVDENKIWVAYDNCSVSESNFKSVAIA